MKKHEASGKCCFITDSTRDQLIKFCKEYQTSHIGAKAIVIAGSVKGSEDDICDTHSADTPYPNHRCGSYRKSSVEEYQKVIVRKTPVMIYHLSLLFQQGERIKEKKVTAKQASLSCTHSY